MTAPLLQIEDISKRFGGVQAVQSISLEAHAGKVLGLIGENGAGKSTLVKILTGIYPPDAGTILFDNQEESFSDPQDASAVGISAIQQEPSMFDELTVAENIFVAAQPRRGPFGWIDWRKMRRDATSLLTEIGASLKPDMLVKDLSVAERHLVSLARALSSDAKLIIFDEPTAALSQSEIRHLYGIIERLKDQGKAIIFISHKFDEIFRICDCYAVLRDGHLVGTGVISDVTEEDLIRLMVGRTLQDIYPKTEATIAGVVLEVADFNHPTEFEAISFSLRKGEILGFYGLVGAGRTEVMEAIFGLNKKSSGTVLVDGKPVDITSPQAAMAAGIAYVPEDRQHHGALLPFSISQNISLPLLDELSRMTFLSPRREEALAAEFGRRVQIKAAGWSQPVEELSGGNQQKVVISKWLATAPRIVILDEPTKGIDVGSKSAVHHYIGELVQQGLSVILVSSELEEVLGISDRLIVMHRGRISGEFSRFDFSSEAVVVAAAGAMNDPARQDDGRAG